ncbi:MAG: hypothetical protein KatS3mg105_2060 [Gemmatales bacterium]|nr:MAG: hypothetical protein KatS3mg105_2060 [Gemmatales bacterium]
MPAGVTGWVSLLPVLAGGDPSSNVRLWVNLEVLPRFSQGKTGFDQGGRPASFDTNTIIEPFSSFASLAHPKV